ncbi:MAG TPA: hypothetical protein EYG94_02790 [Campylobacterales bacterium]|nr:hypothetical protein [Campylobacterales bacterium]
MAARRGMHKIEFYSSLNEIKELYDQGYVVLKILYEEMQKRKNWDMSYWSFLKYAKEELPLKKSTKNETKSETPKVEKEDDGPKIARPNFKKGPKFNPHTVDVDSSRLL